MHRLALLIVSAVVSTWGLAAAAQDLEPSGNVTLNEAVAHALAHRTELRRARNQVATADLEVRGLREGARPVVSAQIRPTQSYGPVFDQTAGQLGRGLSSTLGLTLAAEYEVYDGGRRGIETQTARLTSSASVAAVEDAARRISEDVTRAYLELAARRSALGVQRRALASQTSALDLVAALAEAGVRSRSDVTLQQTAVEAQRIQVAAARSAAASAEAAVAEAAALDPAAVIAGTVDLADLGDLSDRVVLADTIPPVDDLLARAEDRSALRAAALRVLAAERTVAAAEATGRPTLDAFGQVSTGYSSLRQRIVDDDFVDTPFVPQLTNNATAVVGLSLSVPIADRGLRAREVAAARLALDEARADVEEVRRRVRYDVARRALALDAALDQNRLVTAQSDLFAAALADARDKYENGLGTLSELIEAQGRLTDLEIALDRAAADVAFQRILLRLATGDLAPADVTLQAGLVPLGN